VHGPSRPGKQCAALRTELRKIVLLQRDNLSTLSTFRGCVWRMFQGKVLSDSLYDSLPKLITFSIFHCRKNRVTWIDRSIDHAKGLCFMLLEQEIDVNVGKHTTECYKDQRYPACWAASRQQEQRFDTVQIHLVIQDRRLSSCNDQDDSRRT
jgi:hypothetical protein